MQKLHDKRRDSPFLGLTFSLRETKKSYVQFPLAQWERGSDAKLLLFKEAVIESWYSGHIKFGD